jgi:hypothetical protein
MPKATRKTALLKDKLARKGISSEKTPGQDLRRVYGIKSVKDDLTGQEVRSL